MVRQVRKFLLVLVAVLTLIAASCGTVSAATYEPYEDGSMSSTVVNYFRDTVSKIPITCNYVLLRTGQYEYKLFYGSDLRYDPNDQMFISDDECTVVNIITTSGYNSTYEIWEEYTSEPLVIDCGAFIVYSNLGCYPDLEERGAKFEILATIIFVIAGCCYIIRNIFYNRRR